MRKILIFSLVYYPRFIGGAEIAIKEITDRIGTDEMQFDMITLRKQASAYERIGNVNIYRVGFSWFGKNTKSSKIFPLSKIFYIPLAFLKAVSLHRKNKYDLIWSMMASYAGFAGFLFKKKYKQVPFVLSIQEGDNFEKRDGVFRPFFRKIFKSADRIQCISKFLADWSRKMGAKCPIVVVPNAVDYELFSKKQTDDELVQLKSKLGKKENDIFLITTSRLVEKNAVDDIVNSLQYLPENVKLLVIGKGGEEDKLHKLASALNLQNEGGNRVQFLGYIPHTEMVQYLQASDIFIRPSLSEGFGNSFIEAMASGIPVIATPVGGIVDFLTDGETGLFCEVKNPRSIAQKVEKLIKDRESREYIVKNAKKMVEEDYAWTNIVGEMKEVFNSARL